MGQKPQRDPVNPKLILRVMRNALPEVKGKEDFIFDTVTALYAFSDNYIPKDELDEGTVHFWGTASYPQLARFMRVKERTARWRVNQLKDRWGLVDWRRSKYGIKFEVTLQIGNEGTGDPPTTDSEAESGSSDYLSDAEAMPTHSSSIASESGNKVGGKKSRAVTKKSSQVMNSPRAVIQITPSVFDLALSGGKDSGVSRNDFSKDKDQNPNSNTTSNTTGGKPPVPPQSSEQTKETARRIWYQDGPGCSVHGRIESELDPDCKVCHGLLHPVSISEYYKHEKAKKAALAPDEEEIVVRSIDVEEL